MMMRSIKNKGTANAGRSEVNGTERLFDLRTDSGTTGLEEQVGKEVFAAKRRGREREEPGQDVIVACCWRAFGHEWRKDGRIQSHNM